MRLRPRGFFVCIPPPASSGPPPNSGPDGNAGPPGGGPSGDPAGPPPDDGPGPGGDPGGGWDGGWGGGGGCRRADAAGNPIFTGTGNKYQREVDYQAASGLQLQRHYNSALPGWVHNWGARIWFDDSRARVIRPDGRGQDFTGSGPGPWMAPAHVSERLTRLPAGAADGALWQYVASTDATEWYDAQGRLLRVVRRNGQTFTASYADGLLQQVADPFGRLLRFAYDDSRRLQQVTTPEGGTIRYGYDSGGRLASVTLPDGTQRRYLYEDARWPQALTGLIDERGIRVATWAYDAQGRAILSEGPDGVARWRLQFGAAGGSVAVTDPLNTTRIQQFVDAGGRRVFAGQSQPCTGCAGDAAQIIVDPLSGLLARRTGHDGVVDETEWDSARHLPLAVTRAAGRPEAQTVRTQWHPQWRLPLRITEAGRVTDLQYDGRGQLLQRSVTDSASGQVRRWQYTWDERGLLTGMTDPRGAVWRYAYDAQGNRIRETNPLGHETRWEHDAAGRVVRETAADGVVSTWAWDARGRLVEHRRGADITRLQYTPDGALGRVSGPDGWQVDYEYEAAGRLVAARDSRGARMSWQHDAAGNPVREELRDAAGAVRAVRQRSFDALGRLAAETDALGQGSQYGWDAAGQLESVTDPLNHTQRWRRDALRRVVATVFADNAEARQAWDALDGLREVTDPRGVSTRYERNAFGEVVREISPDSGTTAIERDAAGAIVRLTDARGIVTVIERDALGRPTRITRTPPAALDVPAQQARLIWDQPRPAQLARIEDDSGSIAYERDAQGRITRATVTVQDNPSAPTVLVTQYAWGGGGQLSQITYPSGLRVHYRRDASGQIVGIDTQAPGGSARNPRPIVPLLSELRWSALGQPQAWRWFNGLQAQRSFDAAGRMTHSEYARYDYDAAGRITGITQSLAARVSSDRGGEQIVEVPLSWQVDYDRRGRITRMARPGHEQRFEWDANGNRLLAIAHTTHDSDLDGALEAGDLQRIVRESSTIDAASNRLLALSVQHSRIRGTRSAELSSATVRYALDEAGNLTHDGLRQFRYGADNRLVAVRVHRDGQEAQVTYLTNALGQRVFMSEPQAIPAEPDAAAAPAEAFSAWLQRLLGWLLGRAEASASIGTAYSFAQTALPAWALLGEYDNGSAAGRGRTEYIWLPLADGAIPVGLFRGGRLHAIHSDHLGTPRRLSDEQGQTVWQWPYSAFGDNEPTGILWTTPNPRAALTHQPLRIKVVAPPAPTLRHRGQFVRCPGLATAPMRWPPPSAPPRPSPASAGSRSATVRR